MNRNDQCALPNRSRRVWAAVAFVWIGLALAPPPAAASIIVQQHVVSDATADNVPGTRAPDTNGLVTIALKSQDDGSKNIVLRDAFPAGFSFDPDFPPLVTNTQNEAGNVDSVIYIADTPAAASSAGTFYFYYNTGQTSGSFVDGIDPTTGTLNPVDAASVHVISANATVTLSFRIRADIAADTAEDDKVREETSANGLDPATPVETSNDLQVDYTDTSLPGVPQPTVIDSRTVTPTRPDLDIDLSNARLDGIVEGVGARELIEVIVVNRGNAPANDGRLIVTIDKGWGVLVGTALPAGCAPAADIGTAFQYLCTLPTISAANANTVSLPFDLTVADEAESLAFRAVVAGSIPATGSDGALSADSGSNYSLDSIRRDHIGFRMRKSYVGSSEPLSSDADREVQIGEDMLFDIEAIWFGSGFDNVANPRITDLLPPGEGYVSDQVTQTPQLLFSPLRATTEPPGSGTPGDPVRSGLVEWELGEFNNATPTASGIFRTTVTARVLNIDNNAAGYQPTQSDVLTDTLDGSFDFKGVTYDSTRTDWPSPDGRRQSVTVITPGVTVNKQVCNESRGACDAVSGVGFANQVAGAAGESMVYRIVIENIDDARAVAFDLTIQDQLDTRMSLHAFASDGLDNDGDGLTTVAVLGGDIEDPQEGYGDTASGALSFDFIDYPADENDTANAKLQALHSSVPEATTMTIGAGGIVVDGIGGNISVDPPGGPGQAILTYRTTVANNVIPGDILPNTATVSYDTILGDYGAQTLPLGANGEPHGGRLALLSDTAEVHIQNVAIAAIVDLAAALAAPGFDDGGLANADPSSEPSATAVATPGQTVSFTIQIANEGDLPDSYALSAWSDAGASQPLPPGWSVDFFDPAGDPIASADDVQPGPGNTTSFVARISVPPSAGEVDLPIYFAVTSSNSSGATDVIQHVVTFEAASGTARLSLVADQTTTVGPCAAHSYYHGLRNSGAEPLAAFVEIVSQDTLSNQLSLPTEIVDDGPGGYRNVYDLAPDDPVAVFDADTDSWAFVELVDDGRDGVAIPMQSGDYTQVRVTVYVACDTPSMSRDTLVVAAGHVGSTERVANTDVTVVTSVTVDLTKRGAPDVDCDGNADANFATANLRAAPGECVVWRIALKNTAPEPICGIQIRDAVPAFTRLNLPAGAPRIVEKPADAMSTCSADQFKVWCDAGSTIDVNGDATLEQWCLHAGESVAMEFSVEIE